MSDSGAVVSAEVAALLGNRLPGTGIPAKRLTGLGLRDFEILYLMLYIERIIGRRLSKKEAIRLATRCTVIGLDSFVAKQPTKGNSKGSGPGAA